MQHAYTHAALRAQLQRVDTLAAAAGRNTVVRVQAARGYAAGAYLRDLPRAHPWPHRLPAGRKFFEGLGGDHFRITLARHVQQPLTARHAGKRCPLCSGVVDAHGDHPESCHRLQRGRWKSPQHNYGRDAVYTVAQEAGMRPALEQRGLWGGGDAARANQRPADVYLPADAAHGLAKPGTADAGGARGVCIDVEHSQLLCDTHRGSAPAEVLAKAHRHKAGRAAPPGHFMYPLTWNSCGGWHEASLRPMLSKWAALRKAGEDAEDGENGISGAMSQIELRWLPRLSAAAHWGTAQAIVHLRSALAASDGGDAGWGEADEVPYGDVVGLDSHVRAALGVPTT
jgi:hypothetical protein